MSRPSPFACLRLIFAFVLVAVATWASTDTDVWGHVKIGADILRTHTLATTDPYSFTSTQRWVDHEWLSHVIFGAAYVKGGVPLLLLVRAINAAVFLFFVHRGLSSLSASVADVATGLVLIGAMPQLGSVRPQIFTMTMYAGLLLLVPRRSSWMPLLFVLWANTHGGWLIGLGCVIAFSGCHPSRRTVAIAVGCAAATLLTPHGIHLWIALADAIQRGWRDVSEWQPIYRTGMATAPPVIWLATSLMLVWAAITRVEVGRFAWLWSGTVALAAFRSQRLVALYVVTVAILVIARVWSRQRPADRPVSWNTQAVAIVCAFAAAAGVGVYAMLAPLQRCLPPVSQPIAPEPSAVAFIKNAKLHGRVLMWFDWGLYAIWHVGDQLKVSMDNRRETVYSADVLENHLRFYAGDDSGYADRIAADYVWLPKELAAVAQLERDGWRAIFTGPKSVILGRGQEGASVIDDSPLLPGAPCFPNP